MSDWKKDVTPDERERVIQDMVNMFCGLKKYSHLVRQDIVFHCRNFEKEKVWNNPRVNSAQEYHSKIRAKMNKIQAENSDDKTPSDQVQQSVESTVRSGPTWKLESQKLVDLTKMTFFSKENLDSSELKQYERAFTASLQSSAAQFLINPHKHSPKPVRRLTQFEREANYKLVAQCLGTRERPCRPCLLFQGSSANQNFLMVAVYAEPSKTSSNMQQEPSVFDADVSTTSSDRSIALLSKLSTMKIWHMNQLHPHVFSITYAMMKLFPNMDARQCISSHTLVPKTIGKMIMVELPRNGDVVDKEFKIFDQRVGANESMDSLDSIVRNHIKEYSDSKFELQASRKDFYAYISQYAQKCRGGFGQYHVYSTSCVNAMVKTKMDFKRPCQDAGSSSATKFVSHDSEAEDEPTVLKPLKSASNGNKKQNKTVSGNVNAAQDQTYSEFDSDSDGSSSSEPEDDFVPTKRVRGSIDSDDPDACTDNIFHRPKKSKKQTVGAGEKDEEQEQEQAKGKGDEEEDGEDGEDGEEEEEDEEDEEEEEEELKESECEDDDDEEDEEEGEEEEEEVVAMDIDEKVDVELETKPPPSKPPKPSKPDPVALPPSIKSHFKPSAASNASKQEKPDAHSRRVADAISAAEKAYHLGYERCIGYVRKCGFAMQLDEVKEWLHRKLESDVNALQSNNSNANSSSAQHASSSHDSNDSAVQKVPTLVRKHMTNLSEAHKGCTSKNTAFEKAESNFGVIKEKLIGLTDGCTDSKKNASLKALAVLVRDLSQSLCESFTQNNVLHAKLQDALSVHSSDNVQKMQPPIKVESGESMEKIIEQSTKMLLNVMPMMLKMKTAIDGTKMQFSQLCDAVNAHSSELSNVISNLNGQKPASAEHKEEEEQEQEQEKGARSTGQQDDDDDDAQSPSSTETTEPTVGDSSVPLH